MQDRLRAVASEQPTIVATRQITEEIRYRAWRLLWEERVLLDDGYRAYYDRIIDTLNRKRKEGWVLRHPKNGDLDFTALTESNLKYFMGKQSKENKGPSKIHANKFWVIDAYLQVEQPESYDPENYEKQKRLFIKSSANFLNPNINTARIEYNTEFVEGVYVPTIVSMEKSIVEGFGSNTPRIPIYFFEGSDRFRELPFSLGYTNVHKLYVPLYERYLSKHHIKQLGCAAERLPRDGELSFPEIVYNGFGVINPRSGKNRCYIDCLLRNSSTYDTLMCHLDIGYLVHDSDFTLEESLPLRSWTNVERNRYSPSDGNIVYYKTNIDRASVYSEVFYNEISEYFDKLRGVL